MGGGVPGERAGVEALRGRAWAEGRTAALLGLRRPKAAGGRGCGTVVPGGEGVGRCPL